MRRLTLVMTWLVVTALATGVAWTAVGWMTPHVGQAGPRTLSQAAVESALRAPVSGASAPNGTSAGASPDLAPATGDEPGSGAAGATSPATTVASTRPSSSTGGSTGASPPATSSGGSPPPTAPPPSPSSGSPSPASPPSSPTTTAAAQSTVVESTGGVVTVECSGTTIRLVSSSPRNGFSQSVEQAGPQEVSVQFRSSDHESEIHAICQNGRPVAQVSESSGADR